MVFSPGRQEDVVIVGGGPAGTTTALRLVARGIRPLVLDAEAFPRYRIGESLAGEARTMLDELGLGPALDRRGYLAKRGVKISGPTGKNEFYVPMTPGASIQVSREDFDLALQEFARERGVAFLQGAATKVFREGRTVRGVSVLLPGGAETTIGCEVLVDCSGPLRFLAGQGVADPPAPGAFAGQTAVFAQLQGVSPAGPVAGDDPSGPDDTQIFHWGDRRWAWLIPLGQDRASAGVVVPHTRIQELGLSPGAFLQREVRAHPQMERRVRGARVLEPVRTMSRYSYWVERFTGPAHLAVGDAHAFCDPLFSWGVVLALAEGKLAAAAVADHLEGRSDPREPFRAYEERVKLGQRRVEQVLRFFWAFPLHFQRYVQHRFPAEMQALLSGQVHGELNSALAAIQAMLATDRASRAQPGDLRA